jgi:Cd2+/Zn2+-exporting ATPase
MARHWLLALRDTLREDAKAAMADLHQIGVQGVILTGDNPRAASIAAELGMEFRPGCCLLTKSKQSLN